MIAITVQSNIGGKLSGHLQCSIPKTEPVRTLIEKFCETKGITYQTKFLLKTEEGIVLDSHRSLEACGVVNGSTLYFDTKGKSSEIFHFHNWWMLAVGALLIAVVGLGSVIALYLVKGEVPAGYGVVLDGGSTHTSVNVYQWEGSKWKGTGVIKQIGYCSTKGNIAAMATNTSAISDFLNPCLLEAQKKVPAASKPSTPIYFAGTAGLRLLNITNEYAAKLVLQEIRSIFKASGFSYADTNVQILDGPSEGLYSWITVNTQLKNMGPFDAFLLKLGFRDITPNERETVGALDLGGASTQISLEVDEDTAVDNADVDVIELYGQNYSVYTKSHLCYGVVEATRRYHAMLLHDLGLDNISTPVSSPCHPRDFVANSTAADIFYSPCTESPRGIPKKSARYTFVGTSDSERCARLMERLFVGQNCSTYFSNSCFDNQNQPVIGNKTFKAFAMYYYVASSLNVTNETSLSEFRYAVNRVCSASLSELHDIQLNDPLLCLDAQFMLALLVGGYGFDSNAWHRIEFVYKVGDLTVGWAMGYMTAQTNGINIQQPGPLLVLPAFASLAVLFSMFLLIGILLSHHAWKLHKASIKYSRLAPPDTERSYTYGSLTMWL